MKEIPMTLVKANQLMMVVLTLLSIVFQNVYLVGITLGIVAVSLMAGPKANLAFLITRALIKRDLSNDKTEASQLTRFNQSIAASLLFVALVILLVSGHWFAWILVGMVTVAASVALMGFCIGCFLYFQLKQLKYKLSR